jgi:ketosteroid isomerase-like protein
MSQENVEIVQRAIGAAIRRPKPDFVTMNALFHPEHEYVSRIELALEGGSARGGQGYRDWLTTAAETMAWESTLEEVREIDEDRVLAIMPTSVRGKQSGAETEQRLAGVVTVRDGKVVRTEIYRSPEEALAAAGLRE